MPEAELGDGEIYCESHGEGESLLLVPGLGGVGRYWKPNFPALSAKYRVIMHDHRGCEQSSHSKIQQTIEQMADNLLRLLDHLKTQRAHLVGHSTGGAIGKTTAATRPERLASLALSSARRPSHSDFTAGMICRSPVCAD